MDDIDDAFLFFVTTKINLLFFAITFLTFGYYLSNSLIIYYFSPTHLVITEILSLFLRWIIEILFENKIENEDNTIITAKIVGFFIIFISSLIYNEILILHFCYWDKNVENNMNITKLIGIANNDSLNNIKNEDDNKVMNEHIEMWIK